MRLQQENVTAFERDMIIKIFALLQLNGDLFFLFYHIGASYFRVDTEVSVALVRQMLYEIILGRNRPLRGDGSLFVNNRSELLVRDRSSSKVFTSSPTSDGSNATSKKNEK